ncbi:HD domain-containing phosphohydrolase [Fibrobacter sp. UWB12]|uniref:HD domain-containing phosphohydrolase n=1 Tax=Fibrobacter sp. UWB12 TaxID=1896203 RepID=UPI0009197A6F|nr:HD domain-containing phosphohydrolase [Fibrobacter sp. UWB12]SHK36224.1 N-terminal 7TM region of histidine kinase [Fibrobacter sp. UWB12]
MGYLYLTLMFVLSAVNLAVLSLRFQNQRNNYVYYSFYAILVANFGHWLLGFSETVEGAIIANKVNYLGGSFLPMFMFFALLKVCKMTIPKWLHLTLILMSFTICALAMTVGYFPAYYKTVEYVVHAGVGNYVATYGWAHGLFNAFLLSYVILDIWVIVRAIMHQKMVSLKNIAAMIIGEIATIFSFFLARYLGSDMLIMPAIYVIDQILLLYICNNVKWYDITECVIESIETESSCAYMSFSVDCAYLGANRIAMDFFPELVKMRVDAHLKGETELQQHIMSCIEKYRRSKILTDYSQMTEFNYLGRHYKCEVKVLRQVHGKNVFLFRIEDNTQEQQYIDALGRSNSMLQKNMVKTENEKLSVQEKWIVGMAQMAESRAGNMEGHIKRTSEVVKILVSMMRKKGIDNLSDKFLDVLIAAAPMYDLGKVAIDDAVLRKPGRFNFDDYEIMKTHAAKGANIIEKLLSDVKDSYFVSVAKNMALYHHERWDGTGYPERRSGENIPMEARIMALADVYDALVSKRCYKERMSFREARDVIVASMGKQFDPHLKDCFLECQDQLMDYYCSVDH